MVTLNNNWSALPKVRNEIFEAGKGIALGGVTKLLDEPV